MWGVQIWYGLWPHRIYNIVMKSNEQIIINVCILAE